MAIRAILLDFDGTSLQRDQVFISFRNKGALKRALDRGIDIIPCTGRSADMLPPQIEADPRIRYWVTSNGGRVLDRQTGEIIYQSLFTPEESAAICRMYEGRKIYSEIAAEGKLYVEKEISDHFDRYYIPPHHVWYLEMGRYIAVEKPSEHFLANGIGVEKFNIYNVPADMQKPLLDEIQQTGFVYVSDGAGKDIQVFPERQKRTNAMEALFRHLGYGYESVMSIGDSRMDMDMIRKAAIGVAMGNAHPEVKACADYICAPYDQDGVAEAIEKFLLD